MKSNEHTLGGYAIRIEFLQRGSPHAHCTFELQILSSLMLVILTHVQVCEFIDMFITCPMPTEEGQLKDSITATDTPHSVRGVVSIG